MEAGRFMRSVQRAMDSVEEETRRNSERWILTSWSLGQTVHHALRYGDELPPTRKEHDERKAADKAGKDPPINWNEVEEAREQMLESRKLLQYGLQGPSYHAAYLGAEGILDAPEETFEEFKARIAEAGKPDYKQMNEQLEQADSKMRDRALKEKRGREHRS